MNGNEEQRKLWEELDELKRAYHDLGQKMGLSTFHTAVGDQPSTATTVVGDQPSTATTLSATAGGLSDAGGTLGTTGGAAPWKRTDEGTSTSGDDVGDLSQLR